MNIVMTAVAVGIVVCLLGCNEEDPEVGQQTWECPVEVENGSVGVDRQGTLVRFDSFTGAILARAMEHATIEQLAFDPLAVQVVAVEKTPKIVAYGLDLGERRELDASEAGGWILPGPSGLIAFEPDAGWRLLSGTGNGAPLPVAAWIDGDTLHALVPNGAEVDWLSSNLDLASPRFRIALEAPWPESVHAVPAATIEGVIVADEDEGLRIRLVDEAGMARSAIALPGLASVVDLLALGAAARTERIAFVTRVPPTLVVADIGGRRRAIGTFPLSGQPSGGLVAPAPGRLLVATDQGVVAVRIFDDLQLEGDERFRGEGLRGPLAGPLGKRAF